jgi:hypothetical protein
MTFRVKTAPGLKRGVFGPLLRPWLSCGIVSAIPARHFPALIAECSIVARLLMKVTSVARALCCLPPLDTLRPPRRAAAGRVCDAKGHRSGSCPVRRNPSEARQRLFQPRTGRARRPAASSEARQPPGPGRRRAGDSERCARGTHRQRRALRTHPPGSSAFCRARSTGPSHTGIHASIASRTSLFG